MLREYFSWIGLFTNSKAGVELLKFHKIFALLKKYVGKNGLRDHMLRIILLSVNYAQESSRDLLLHCLKYGSVELRKVSMNIVRFLYRAETRDLLHWVRDALLA